MLCECVCVCVQFEKERTLGRQTCRKIEEVSSVCLRESLGFLNFCDIQLDLCDGMFVPRCMICIKYSRFNPHYHFLALTRWSARLTLKTSFSSNLFTLLI